MKELLGSQGYLVFKKFINHKAAKEIKEAIEKEIRACALDLGCCEEEYLSVVSRWMDPSPVTACIDQKWVVNVAQQLSEWAGEEVILHEMHVIYKNAYKTGSIPLHQDISYSPKDPYQFSSWIALDDVFEESGPLSVVPKSHLEGIFPAVDFWSPYFEASERESIPLLVEKGDAICFDSRLWHGSLPNRNQASRCAWVQRWSIKSWKLKEEIPPAQSLPFGMWVCGEEIKKCLSKGIQDPPQDLVDLIEVCSQKFPLEKLKILELANRKHHGGDATGTIYKELWHHFKTLETEQ